MNKKGAKVMYLSSEVSSTSSSTRSSTTIWLKFRKRYRQAISSSSTTSSSSAARNGRRRNSSTLSTRSFDGHKQIVLSSDRPPSEIANLEHRLVSRFEWGLTAELQPPDVETRMAILRKKAHTLQIKLREEVFEFLREPDSHQRAPAGRGRSCGSRSFRFAERQGADQRRRRAFAQGHSPGRSAARGEIDQIQRRVAEHFDVRLADMNEQAPAGEHRLSRAKSRCISRAN